VWHPGDRSGRGAHTSLHLDEAVLLHGIRIKQYSWGSGFASTLSLMLNSSRWSDRRDLTGEERNAIKPVNMQSNLLFIYLQWQTGARWRCGRQERTRS
jgi:hypothetical protein